MNPNKYLSQEERADLEASMRSRLETDTRNALLILVALHSGARASELLGVQWNDLDLESGALVLRTAKSYKRRASDTDSEAERKRKRASELNARTLVLPRFLLEPLKRLRSMSPARPFALSYNRLGELWREYRNVKKPFHALRHTFAVDAFEKSANVFFVKECLGHANIQNTMVYTHKTYDAKEYKRIMRVR